MGTIKTLEKLFMEELYDLYSVEQQIITALTKMIKKANNEKLKKAFEDHLETTRNQKERLNKVFDEVGKKARSKKCEAMEGIIKEGEEMIKEAESDGAIMDAVLIAAAQKVEHYEIASYGSIATFAKQLGHSKAAELLEETLKEEKNTDKLLSKLAKNTINEKAMAKK